MSIPGLTMLPNWMVLTPISLNPLLLDLLPLPPLSEHISHKWEKTEKETSYIWNHSADCNRCITKIQDSVQEQLKILQSKLGKAKPSGKAQKALEELNHLTYLNQNVSSALGKAF